MVARARRSNESFAKYRKNLKGEAIQEKNRLKGRMTFTSIMFSKIKNALGLTQVSKKTRSLNRTQERQRLKAERAGRAQMNRKKAQLRRVQNRG